MSHYQDHISRILLEKVGDLSLIKVIKKAIKTGKVRAAYLIEDRSGIKMIV